ncbi:MAG: substrate-binding domain-containing protein [Hyphomicrobiales bacterium]
MTRTRKAFATMAAFTSAGLAILVALQIGVGIPRNIAPVPEAPPTVHVTIASSVTKQRWLEAAAVLFKAANIRTSTGRSVSLSIKGVLSGDSMEQILSGELKPVVWSPGEGSWVSQLNRLWASDHNRPLFSQVCKPTIYTPSGVGIWQPMAEALGWPKKKIGWKTIIELAADPQGWGRYGHPEWGKLKLGYTHPKYSSAGLLFLASVVYGLTGKTSGLSPDEVYLPAVEQAMSTLAGNTTKYGMVTTGLLDMMAKQGPDFLHVISAFEEGVVRFNLEHGKELRWPLVFVFPTEGTFWSDHPYCILDGADWVDPEQAEAARLFVEFLARPEQQRLAGDYLLRPLSATSPVGTRLSIENGTDPSSRPETVPPYEVPDGETAAAIIDQFQSTKRKATIMLVLDVSGSMSGEPIRAATDATIAFLRRLDPRDEIGLMVFNDAITTVAEIRPSGVVSEELARRVSQLLSGGGTNLNGAICKAVEKVDTLKKSSGAAGSKRLYGIVVLSDGADTQAEISENRMFQSCLPINSEGDGTKIFTIGFGDNANLNLLGRIAHVTGGAMFKADGRTIDQAYLKISAEQ